MKKYKICIDAGHNYSGYDTGAVGNGLKEQNVTFEIANKLKILMEGAGVEVIMTRDKLTDNVGMNAKDSINERARIANRAECGYFISIHCNASVHSSASGTEVLICGRGGKAEKLAEKISKSVSNRMGLANRGVHIDKEYLGYSVGVLRLTDMPAVLVETAFISNSSDAALLKNNTEGFAKAIFEGIMEDIGNPVRDIYEPKEIVEKLSEIIEINEKARAVEAVESAKRDNSSLYWILYKIVNK